MSRGKLHGRNWWRTCHVRNRSANEGYGSAQNKIFRERQRRGEWNRGTKTDYERKKQEIKKKKKRLKKKIYTEMAD